MLSLIKKVNKEKFLQSLLVVIISWMLMSCATQQPQPIKQGAPYTLITKAKIKNEGETNTVSIDIAVLPNRAIRMELTGALGVSVASVLMSPNEIKYALHGSKEFVSGPFQTSTLYAVFKKNIDPLLIWNLVQNRPIVSTDWKCELNSSGQQTLCKGLENQSVGFTYIEAKITRIDIISNGFEMNWLFKQQKALAGAQNETFVLKRPEQYREIIIK